MHWLLLGIGLTAWAGVFVLGILAGRTKDARWHAIGLVLLDLVIAGVFFGLLMLDLLNRQAFGKETWVGLAWLGLSAVLTLGVLVPLLAGPVRRRRLRHGWDGRWW